MKIKELLSGIQVPITNEEAEVYEKLGESILKSELTEREQLLANNLVTKDLVSRRKNADGKIIFCKKNKNE